MMRVTVSGLLLSCVALAQVVTSGGSMEVQPGLGSPPSPEGSPATMSTQANQDCDLKLDVVVVADVSSSLARQQFEEMRSFVEMVIRSLFIGPHDMRVSLVVFSTEAHVEWDFNDPKSTNKREAISAVQHMTHRGGRTNTAAALEAASKILFEREDSGDRTDAPKAVILLTDGESNDPSKTREAAKNLREAGVAVVVVAVGDKVNRGECRAVADCATSDEECSLLVEADWGALASRVTSLVKVVCRSGAQDATCSEWSQWSECSATCGAGTKSRTRLQLTPPVPGTPRCETCKAPQGRSCEENGGLVMTQPCFVKPCDVDAGCGDWQPWSEWSETCDQATRTRKREPYNDPPARGNGRVCQMQSPPKYELETQTRSLPPCAPGAGQPGDQRVDTLYGRKRGASEHRPTDRNAGCGDWGGWSEWSQTCGTATRTRTREPYNDPEATGRGLTCDEQGKYQIDSEVKTFPACVEGQQGGSSEQETRDHGRKSSSSGRTRGASEQRTPDRNAGCGDWGGWSEWSQTCGTATRTRTREPYNDPKATGRGLTCDEQGKYQTDSEVKTFAACVEGQQGGSSEQETHDHGGNSDESHAEEVSGTAGSGASEHAADGHQQQEQQTGSSDQQSKQDKTEGSGTSAVAIAGGVIGVVILACAAGGGYHYYKGRTAGHNHPSDHESLMSSNRDAVEQEREAMISIGDESNMWADN